MDVSHEKASLEWETIVECSTLLIDSIKRNIDNIGNEFHSKWFLSESEYESLKQIGPGSEPSIRARKIISAVEDRVKFRPALFKDFVAVLRSQGEWMRDCTEKVEQCYEAKQFKRSKESQGPGFVCPYCQKCTLEGFFMSGCPKIKEKKIPPISSPTFPYLDTKRLSEPEKHMLLDNLTTDYESIVSAFRKLCMTLSKSQTLKDEIDNIKLFLSASAIFSKEEKMQLSSSKEMFEVLMILLLERASFFNHQTIELVVNEYGSSDDKCELQKYLDEFNSYCKHNVFEVPHAVFHPGQNEDIKHSTFALKYSEEGPIMLQKITKICNRIAKTLHINSWALSLVSIEKGCVFLTFAIPIAIATEVLPISEAQLMKLSRYGLGGDKDIGALEDSHGKVATTEEYESENATDTTGESGYGTGEAVRQQWIQGGLQSMSVSADSDFVSVKDANQYTPLLATFSEIDSGPYTSVKGILPRRPPRPDREDKPFPPLPTTPTHQILYSVSGASNAHLRRETWYCEVDRHMASELLRNKENGTFLCRPTVNQWLMPKGEQLLHTHSIDIVYNGLIHLKVFTLNNKYGFSLPCTSNSLEELVFFYKENSLEEHNHRLTTTLKYPVHAALLS